MVMPSEGFLVGWRDELTRRFPPPPSTAKPEHRARRRDGRDRRVDAAILTLGSLWDFAAPEPDRSEAGGVFRDAWGGTRFDTHSGVFTNPALVEDVLVGAGRAAPAEA